MRYLSKSQGKISHRNDSKREKKFWLQLCFRFQLNVSMQFIPISSSNLISLHKNIKRHSRNWFQMSFQLTEDSRQKSDCEFVLHKGPKSRIKDGKGDFELPPFPNLIYCHLLFDVQTSILQMKRDIHLLKFHLDI